MVLHNNPGLEKRFILSIIITTVILVAEVIGGIWTGSLALLSDSAHVFMDIFALGLSFLAIKASARPADDRHSYGWHRLEVIAALINGISLFVIAIGIWVEAYDRLQETQHIRSTEMLIIAVIGLIANLVVAFVLGHKDEHEHANQKDLNVSSAFLHVLGDAVSSVGVIIAAILIQLTGANWLDPVISILIGILIIFSSFRVLRSSLHILVEGVPEGLSLARITNEIKTIQGVASIHDLHVWNICSGTVALSAHVVVSDGISTASILNKIKTLLHDDFSIEHTTIQIEGEACGQCDEPAHA
jgi:cobalt-zinc-cadmium efflux system protein